VHTLASFNHIFHSHLIDFPENSDASSNEAAHLQQKLKNLSTELVSLRNRLHVTGAPAGFPCNGNNDLVNLPSKNMVIN
jgi:hypothetical protein